VAHKVTGNTPLAVGGAAALLALCAGLWFGWPLGGAGCHPTPGLRSAPQVSVRTPLQGSPGGSCPNTRP
jgi:hypothetical protein